MHAPASISPVPDPATPPDVIADNAAAIDRVGADAAREIAALCEARWLAACLPRGTVTGASGWGSEPEGRAPALTALRALGRANLSVARLFEGHMNAVELVMRLGNDDTRGAMTDIVRGGGLSGVWGADEPGNPVRIEGDALQGAKMFASGLGLVDHAVVLADSEAGKQLVLVDTSDPARGDASGWNVAGMRATRSGRYDFSGLTRFTAVGAPDAYFEEPRFEGGIWRYCAAHLGGAEALYLAMRDMLTQSGRAEDPHQQRRIAEAAVAIETGRLWVERASTAVEAHDALPEAATLSLMAREAVVAACRTVLHTSDEALGTRAYLQGTLVERVRRDLSFWLCQAVPDAKRARIASAMIGRATLPETL